MNINRHNYEEFFILYWDNELSVQQKKMVEDFAEANTDLREEFSLLGQSRFSPDKNVAFDGKQALLNEDHTFINISNYYEKLLYYIDNELSAGQKEETEKFILQYHPAKKELELLQKTKLQPESAILFPEKSLLYRREEKVRVIGIGWRRVAVAAAIILIAGLGMFRIVNPGKPEDPVKIVKGPETPPAVKTATGNPGTQPSGEPGTQDLASKGKEKPGSKKIKSLAIQPNPAANNLAINKVENKNKLPERRIIADQNETAYTSTSPETITEPDLYSLKKADKTSFEKYTDAKNDNPAVTINPGYALNIKTPDDIVPIPEKDDKGGLKGFLRKATRVFERRTKIQTTTDDNKLLVGAFAVSLK